MQIQIIWEVDNSPFFSLPPIIMNKFLLYNSFQIKLTSVNPNFLFNKNNYDAKEPLNIFFLTTFFPRSFFN